MARKRAQKDDDFPITVEWLAVNGFANPTPVATECWDCKVPGSPLILRIRPHRLCAVRIVDDMDGESEILDVKGGTLTRGQVRNLRDQLGGFLSSLGEGDVPKPTSKPGEELT